MLFWICIFMAIPPFFGTIMNVNAGRKEWTLFSIFLTLFWLILAFILK